MKEKYSNTVQNKEYGKVRQTKLILQWIYSVANLEKRERRDATKPFHIGHTLPIKLKFHHSPRQSLMSIIVVVEAETERNVCFHPIFGRMHTFFPTSKTFCSGCCSF